MPYQYLEDYVKETFPHLLSLISQEQYEQIDWIDKEHNPTIVTSEANVSPASASSSTLSFQQRRIFARLHFLHLLKQGDEEAYTTFINGQASPQLTRDSFIALSSLIHTLPETAYQQLWIAVTISKCHTADKRAEMACEEKGLQWPSDSAAFLALSMCECPAIYPAVQSLIQQDPSAKEGLEVIFSTGQFRHMMYMEGGAKMFEVLQNKMQNKELPDEVRLEQFNLWFAYWLIDIAAFRGCTPSNGSAYLNENTCWAMLCLKNRLLENLYQEEKTGIDVIACYAQERCRRIGLAATLSSASSLFASLTLPDQIVLGRLAAMMRIFTEEEGLQLLDGLTQLKEKVGVEAYQNILTTLNLNAINHMPTPTFSPSLFANLYQATEKNLPMTVMLGLPIYVQALQVYTEPSEIYPLNFRELAKQAEWIVANNGSEIKITITSEGIASVVQPTVQLDIKK